MVDQIYHEILEDTPIQFAAPVAARRLVGETYPFKYVLDYIVRVRSLGTATYIAIGNQAAQEYRLIAIGGTFERKCRRYEVIDLTKVWIRADVADNVVEVAATFLPFDQYGKVKKVA
jgi:hypothetical protein